LKWTAERICAFARNALGTVRLGDAMPRVAPDKKARRMIGQLGHRLDFLGLQKKTRRARQIFRPFQPFRRMQRRNAARHALGQQAFDR